MISISLQIDMNLVGYVVCERMVHCRCNDSSIGMLPVTPCLNKCLNMGNTKFLCFSIQVLNIQAYRLCLISHPYVCFSAFTRKFSHAQLMSYISSPQFCIIYKPSVVLIC